MPPSSSNTWIAAQACTGGLTSEKFHSYAGIWPFGCMYHSRSSRTSWSLANARVDVRQGHAVEGQIPGGEPGVLPRVGHQDDFVVVQVPPVAVADRPAAGRRRRLARIAGQPARHVVVEELLAPEQARRTPAGPPGLLGWPRSPGSPRRRRRPPRPCGRPATASNSAPRSIGPAASVGRVPVHRRVRRCRPAAPGPGR